jgi:hypothetical protein
MTNDPNKTSKRDVAPRYSDSFSALRAEMDSLFDSFIGGLPAFSEMFGSSGVCGFALTPHMDVTETERPWLAALLARRPTKVAAIALANKIARICCESWPRQR